jgi:tetratricopeptide (TPR) repeat protein
MTDISHFTLRGAARRRSAASTSASSHPPVVVLPSKQTQAGQRLRVAGLCFIALEAVFIMAMPHPHWNLKHIPKLTIHRFKAEAPDVEALSSYAETINPPPSDVVMPPPSMPDFNIEVTAERIAPPILDLIGPELPEAEMAPDPALDSEVAPPVPPTPLQLAKPKAPPEVAVSIVKDKLIDTPAMRLPRIAEFKSLFRKPVGNDGSITERMLGEARRRLEAGDDTSALAIYEHILTREKMSRAALAGEALIMYRQSRSSEAPGAEHQQTRDAKDIKADISLISALGAWGALAGSEELQHLAERGAALAPEQVALARGLSHQGNFEAALAHARDAEQSEPNNPFFQLDLAILYDQYGNAAAVPLYLKVLNLYETMENAPSDLPLPLSAIRERVTDLETQGLDPQR